VDELQTALAGHAYLADRGLATAVYLALHLDKPLLLEGEAGVGAPEVPEALARQVAEAVARLREMDVAKRPGVAETIDWSQALTFLGVTRLEPEQAEATLGALLKDHEDLELVRARLGQVLGTE
jgi:MoxR-like ATPase